MDWSDKLLKIGQDYFGTVDNAFIPAVPNP